MTTRINAPSAPYNGRRQNGDMLSLFQKAMIRARLKVRRPYETSNCGFDDVVGDLY